MMKHRMRLVLAGFAIAFVGAVVASLIRRSACAGDTACVALPVSEHQEPARTAA